MAKDKSGFKTKNHVKGSGLKSSSSGTKKKLANGARQLPGTDEKKRGRVWTTALDRRLEKLYPHHLNSVIGEKLGLTAKAINSRGKKLGLRKAPGFNRSIIAITTKEKAFIRKNYTRYTNHELAKITGRSESTIQKVRAEFNLSKPNEGCFKPGMIPINKGKKQIEFMSRQAIARTKATRFKKGNLPHNTKYNGAIEVRNSKGRPYQWIRIAKGKWELLNRYVWRKNFGRIPRGFNVEFKDGNPLNCKPGNLHLVTRKENMLNNSIMRFPPELRSTIMLVSKVKRKINQYAEK